MAQITVRSRSDDTLANPTGSFFRTDAFGLMRGERVHHQTGRWSKRRDWPAQPLGNTMQPSAAAAPGPDARRGTDGP